MMKRAACYCRVSTHKDGQMESLEKQQEFFRRFFENNPEYELYRLYTDEGISAKSLRNRKQFCQMLSDAQAGCFDVIFVKDVSRFARNVQDFFNSLAALEQCGVRIHFVTLNLKTEEASRFTLGLMALLAEDESQRLSEKVKFGKQVTARQGRVPNFVFGYDRTDNFTLVPNPQEAAWIRRIFHWYTRQGIGTGRIAQLLNEAGVPSKRGHTGAWTQNTVAHVLKNELYTGRVINRQSEVVNFRTGARRQIPQQEWITFERPQLRLIEQEVFDRAGALMQGRAQALKRQRRRESTAHSFSNLLYCAQDGRVFRRCVRKLADNKQRVWWGCSLRSAQGTGSCANAAIVPEPLLLQAVSGLFAALLSPQDAAQVAKLAQAKLAQSGLNRGKNLIRGELRSLQAQRQRAITLYTQGVIQARELEQALGVLSPRMDEIEAVLSYDRQNTHNRIKLETRAKLLIEALVQNTHINAPAWMMDNMFLKSVFSHLAVYPDGRVLAHLTHDSGKPAAFLLCHARSR